MLLTTAGIALSRKVADKRAKEREKKQGHLQVGSSDVAKRAFGAQTSKMIEDGSAGIDRRGTEIKFEDADQVTADSPSVPSGGVYSPDVEVHDARSSSQVNVTSPVQSEKAAFGAASPYAETPTSAAAWPTNSSTLNTPATAAGATMEPPPYSPQPASSNTPLSPSASSPRPESYRAPTSPSVYSRDTKDSNANTLSKSDSRSTASGSTDSRGGHGIRVKTKGGDLKSGFPYHPALFDLHIAPHKWEDFSYQLIESTKFDSRDYTRMVGAATATALTGAIGTSVWVGRSMNRKLQEEKVKQGLIDTKEGGLGDTLKQWNDDYFGKLGLFVHMELSESAMKNPEKSKTFRKPTLMYSNRADRERKTEERKFVLVVTKLDDEGNPSQAISELAGKDDDPVEIGSSGDVSSKIAEMPADEGNVYVELPAEMPVGVWEKEKKLDPPEGYVEMEGSAYVEMDGDNSATIEKLHLEGNLVEADPDAEKNLTPAALDVKNNSAAFDTETT